MTSFALITPTDMPTPMPGLPIPPRKPRLVAVPPIQFAGLLPATTATRPWTISSARLAANLRKLNRIRARRSSVVARTLPSDPVVSLPFPLQPIAGLLPALSECQRAPYSAWEHYCATTTPLTFAEATALSNPPGKERPLSPYEARDAKAIAAIAAHHEHRIKIAPPAEPPPIRSDTDRPCATPDMPQPEPANAPSPDDLPIEDVTTFTSTDKGWAALQRGPRHRLMGATHTLIYKILATGDSVGIDLACNEFARQVKAIRFDQKLPRRGDDPAPTKTPSWRTMPNSTVPTGHNDRAAHNITQAHNAPRTAAPSRPAASSQDAADFVASLQRDTEIKQRIAIRAAFVDILDEWFGVDTEPAGDPLSVTDENDWTYTAEIASGKLVGVRLCYRRPDGSEYVVPYAVHDAAQAHAAISAVDRKCNRWLNHINPQSPRMTAKRQAIQ